MSAKNIIASTPPTPSTTPNYSTPLTLLTRISYAIQVHILKTIVSTALFLTRLIQRSKHAAIAPTYTKRYPIRPMLESRVFIPKSHKSGTKLPLYINIHGGGFTVADPQGDDDFARYFADTFGYCVVSIDYRKAPGAPFPVPTYDALELTRAVLDDSDLPFDAKRVAIGGFSAGANLALGVVQFKDVRERISAVVPVYPPTDMATTNKREYKATREGKKDVLTDISKLFNWAYIPANQDRRDPLLSVINAKPEDLPGKIYFIGCEFDALCKEAEKMARKLAGIGYEEKGNVWSINGIKWEMVLDVQHGFTHMETKGEDEVKRVKISRDLYGRMDAWLREEGFQN